ncbi:hypothetical protein AVEN_13289-1 [Araneus ventricosus]|uniref:Uncharacterized protein n=1 Tax=Araneus ventricosus TaxID=182803 RepID=A0A4Y2EX98_ARAVE|nr:hypothetical protein AVEN_13289-1 [Araneus ventricosus]
MTYLLFLTPAPSPDETESGLELTEPVHGLIFRDVSGCARLFLTESCQDIGFKGLDDLFSKEGKEEQNEKPSINSHLSYDFSMFKYHKQNPSY